MQMKGSTYVAIRELLQQWYGLANDRANLQVLVAISEMLEKDIREIKQGQDDK